MISKNSRGSEWRRWDLHVHTPESGMNNGFSNWDSYIKALFEKAVEKEIAVIGITDYFTIDGYKRVLDYLNNDNELNRLFNNDLELIAKIKKIKILPNIELRLKTLVNNRRINYHIIFSDTVSPNDIEENFLHEIDCSYEGVPFAAGNTRKLKKSNLEALGKKIKSEQSSFSGSDFSVGCSVAVVDNTQIMQILESHRDLFEGKFLIVIPVDEDLSKLNWNGQEHIIRKCLYQEANLFFTANPKTIEFGLGKLSESVENFVSEFKSLKPCIHGSDAHSEDKLFTPDKDRFCWIKADPSYEGLKQVIFEPEHRVRIQTEKPENKNDYQIIDSISLNNSEMGEQTIEFNQNLNTIIGGRSSGKSLLLGCLVKAIDSNLLPKDNSKNEKYNNYVNGLCSGIRIKWKDGSDEQRKIIYYSQSQISASVRVDENGISGINGLIESVIKSDNNKERCIQDYEDFLIENRTIINDRINTLCDLKLKISEQNSKLSDIGSLSGITSEINKIQEKILAIKSGMTDYLNEKDDGLFNQLKKDLQEKNLLVNLLRNDIQQLRVLSEKHSFPTIDASVVKLSNETKECVQNKFNQLKNEFVEKWREFIGLTIDGLNNHVDKYQSNINDVEKNPLYIRGLRLQNSNSALAEQEKLLKEEEHKKELVTQMVAEIENLNTAKNKCKDEIFEYFKSYEEKTIALSRLLSLKKDDVEINASVVFLKDKFYEKALQNLNKKNAKIKSIETYLGQKNEVTPIPMKPIDLFEGIVSGEFSVIKKEFQQVMVDLFADNYYKISYDVQYGNDSLNEMSEGKKAYIVLRLLLDFDDSLCPIIIDQPEDDLDNRTIYGDLVKYIREQKTRRQIILATHNPNVVVGADAELVVVANQHGCNSKNQDDVKFEYYANSLENSFVDRHCSTTLLSKGIREHVCEILEGGDEAFRKREQKYKS